MFLAASLRVNGCQNGIVLAFFIMAQFSETEADALIGNALKLDHSRPNRKLGHESIFHHQSFVENRFRIWLSLDEAVLNFSPSIFNSQIAYRFLHFCNHTLLFVKTLLPFNFWLQQVSHAESDCLMVYLQIVFARIINKIPIYLFVYDMDAWFSFISVACTEKCITFHS